MSDSLTYLNIAIRAHANGNFEEAKYFYKKTLIEDPQNTTALGWLGAIEAQHKNYDVAKDLLLKALVKEKNNQDFLLNYANILFETRQFCEAVKYYQKAIRHRPNDPICFANLAACYNEQNYPLLGLGAADQSIQLKPDYAEAWSNRGNALKDLKRYDEALASHERALQLKPDYAEAWSNRGNALKELKRYDEAIASYDKALSLKTDYAEGWFNKGNILNELKRYDEAIAHYDKALSLKCDYAESWSNKGNVLNELKRYNDAITHYDKALSLKPDYAEGWSNQGVTLNELKRHDEALASHERALQLKPDYAEGWSNRGNALKDLKRYDEAIASHDKALSLKPDYAEGWSNKGVSLQSLKRFDEALAHYDKALSLKPDFSEAWYNKGGVLYGIARPLDARICFEKALELRPNFHRAKWAKLFTSIPVACIGNENLQELRKTFSFELEKLDEWFIEKNLDEAHEIIGSVQPFYLAYQVFNNRELLDKYGQLCHRLMNDWKKNYQFRNGIEEENGKIKVGIVGEQIRNHSVWNAITKGLVFNLDHTKFEIHIFHLGNAIDEETHAAKIKATTFTNNIASLLGWTKAIIEENIDVLLYPEIGMDSLTTQLASLRLAPIQLASWGHPQTTGLPTVDYFLSAELFEDGSSQDAYTETLIKLPNLGCTYSRLPITANKFDLEDFGIASNQPILICPGTPFKYTPQHDWILVEIAKRLGKCKLIFFNYENNHLSEILRVRLEKVFNKSNLAVCDYVIFIPWLKPEDFYGLMKCADVLLDPIGFSGFNTAMQAVDCALPIVAREGQFLRSRLASGILKKIAISELIASTDEAYIELATRLVQDKLYRNQIANKMTEMRDILYDDVEPIDALEKFLLNKTAYLNKAC